MRPDWVIGTMTQAPDPSIWRRIYDVLRRGNDVHLAIAMLHLFTLPLATAPSAVTLIMLLVYSTIRLHDTHKSYDRFFAQPMPWAFAAWAAWIAVTIAWSVDPSEGREELGTMRYALLLFALWPLRDRTSWLIGAALMGVAAQNLAQLLEALDWVNVRPQDARSFRVGGLIHPIQTGMWCVAALCWYASAILMSRKHLPLLLIGAGAAAAGLFVSGSRGPWLAGVVTLPLFVLVAAIAVPAARRRALLLTVVVVIVGAIASALPAVRGAVEERVDSAVQEYRAAVDDQAYGNAVGLRVGLAGWARQIGAERPLFGQGAGSFETHLAELPDFQAAVDRITITEKEKAKGSEPLRKKVREREKKRLERKQDFIRRAHAHNSALHLYATTGLIGVALAGSLLLIIFVGAWRNRASGLFEAGTPFVVIAWLIGTQFDTFHLNGHLFGLICLCAALAMRRR